MSADSQPPIIGRSETPSVAAVPVRRATASADFASIAKRMSSRTIDLLAIAIVLTASLVFGRQVIVWWRSEPPDATALSEPAVSARSWGADGLPVFLEFGNSGMSLTRQTVSGDRAEAGKALIRLCRTALEQAPIPARAPDAAETRFVAKLVELKPIAEEPGDWQMFQLQQALPLVAALRWISPPGQNANNATASSQRRLVCFALALPGGAGGWTLYGFQPSGTTAQLSGQTSVPLPEGARQIMSVRDERGGSLVAFHGRAAPESWRHFYSEWAASQGVTSHDVWIQSPLALTARFELDRSPRRLIVEVHIATEGQEKLTGLLNVVPSE